MRQRTGSSLVQIRACRLFGEKPLPEPVLAYHQLHPSIQISLTLNTNIFFQEKSFKNAVCKTAATLFRPEWVKAPHLVFALVEALWYQFHLFRLQNLILKTSAPKAKASDIKTGINMISDRLWPQVYATHLKIGQPQKKAMHTRPYNELQWLDLK